MNIRAEIKKLKNEYDANPTLERLAELRSIMADAQDANEASEGFKNLLTQLYPDNAHFIYELLQNAEDASRANKNPSTVKFTLLSDCLVFEHNGEKLFDIKDVDAITGLGVSTKIDDTTSIGKFGVGFKSVFIMTDKPEIISGDFHFEIERLFIPIPLTKEETDTKNKMPSRFIFPFINPDYDVETIENELLSLGCETLLFLKNISRIEFLIQGGQSFGYIERTDVSDKINKIVANIPNQKRSEVHWLRYDKEIIVKDENGNILCDGNGKPIVDENGNPVKCTISIAYKLDVSHTKKQEQDTEYKIVPTEPKTGNVFIFFPAVKENSGLRFYINAPFASTVARDSIRTCDENRFLRDNLGALVAESLTDIKNRNMLNMDFLAVLPNYKDDLGDYYEPIRKSIIEEFQKKPLVPTKSGDFAPSESLYRGPIKISEIIDDDDLSLLTGYDKPLWAKNPPRKDSSREDQFLESLKIDKWEYHELEIAFNPDDDEVEKIENWIASKSDEWLMRLYALLNYMNYEYYNEIDSSLRIVRTTENKHVEAENAYFQPESVESTPKSICFVKPEIYNAGSPSGQRRFAKEFLELIGVKEYSEDEKNRLKLIELSKKYGAYKPNIEVEQHLNDIIRFLKYEEREELLKDKYFVLNESGEYVIPNMICTPLIQDLIESIGTTYSQYKKDCMNNCYEKLDAKNYDNFIQLIGNMGAMTKLTVEDIGNFYHRDYSIRDIEKIAPLVQKHENGRLFAKLIFDAVVNCNVWNVEFLQFRPDGRHNFRNKINSMDGKPVYSTIVRVLSENYWVPDKEGNFYKPQDIAVEVLPPDFTFNDRHSYLFEALKFGKNVHSIEEFKNDAKQKAERLAAELSVKVEDIKAAKYARDNNIPLVDLIEKEMLNRSRKPALPEASSPNPERRKERVEDEYSDAPDIEYEKVLQSRRVSKPYFDKKVWLRSQYENIDRDLVCQICKEIMPFRGRDGEYYFEAVSAFNTRKKKNIEKETEINSLALCPLCAAKFSEHIQLDEQAMDEFVEMFSESDGNEVPIQMGEEKASVYFTTQHMRDLKTILGVGDDHQETTNDEMQDTVVVSVKDDDQEKFEPVPDEPKTLTDPVRRKRRVEENTTVIHKIEGKGTVSRVDGNRIYVIFGSNEKSYFYPDAFDKGFLRVEQ